MTDGLVATESYGLRLADGSRWALTAYGDAAPWLAELAHITSLQRVAEAATHTLHVWNIAALRPITPPPLSDGDAWDSDCWQEYTHGGIHRFWRHVEGREIHLQLVGEFLDHAEIRYINMSSCLRELHRYALLHGGTPVHGALAELDGQGVVICAAGGVGKSTCSRRLPAPWRSLCDDQTLLLRNGQGQWGAHPLPTWSEYLFGTANKRWQLEPAVPLTAIFYLQAADRDHCTPLAGSGERTVNLLEAAQQVWQVAWGRLAHAERTRLARRLLDNVSGLAPAVPAFRLEATLDGEFWRAMERSLSR